MRIAFACSLSEAGSVKPAALRCCSTSLPTATERTANAATAARTSFGCFQVRSGDCGRTQWARTVPEFKVATLIFKPPLATIGSMGRREYDQPCSLASALDQVGERWSLLVVRELTLGPLRFSELDRAVGGAPTDVLTNRLRDLEAVGRRPPGRARPAGLGDRLRADRARPRARAADARTRALGAQLPRPRDGRRDAAGDAAERSAGHPRPPPDLELVDRPAHR